MDWRGGVAAIPPTLCVDCRIDSMWGSVLVAALLSVQLFPGRRRRLRADLAELLRARESVPIHSVPVPPASVGGELPPWVERGDVRAS